jgi:hypothetical protein
MENKVVISYSDHDINKYLNQGWIVKMVVAQHPSPNQYLSDGCKFCFVLERPL